MTQTFHSSDVLAKAQGANPPERMGCEAMPGFFRLLAQAPTVLKAFVQMDECLTGGKLNAAQRERIALAIAEINGSVYGLSAHYEAARRLGLSESEISRARQAHSEDSRTETLLRFVRAVALQRGEIGDHDFEPLRQAGFGAEEMLEIIANIALNLFADYCNNAARTQVDFPLLQPGVETPGAHGQTAMAARMPRLAGGQKVM